MRRWTDGKSWSPSRVTGSFLTYRELDEGSQGGKNVYRADGLLKQSFSITTSDNKKLHLISYYTNEDVASERLTCTPTRDALFANIVVPKGIYPETASTSEALSVQASVPSLSSTHQSSPSPPTPHRSRHRPHHRSFPQKEQQDPKIKTETPVSSMKEHRYSPMQANDHNKHGLSSRSRSNSHNNTGHPFGSYGPGPEKRYKSSSPTATSSFPTPPPNAYSPTGSSWASEDDQPLVMDMETVTPESMDGRAQEGEAEEGVMSHMIPPLRELPLLASSFDLYKNTSCPASDEQYHPHHDLYMPPSDMTHEQDSLSVLANLATDALLLPKLEPKEISRERVRWVEDDRQLRALSSMLRL